MNYFIETEVLKSKEIQRIIAPPKFKASEEIRVEPPVPVEPIVKSNIEIKHEKSVKVDSGNSISNDAIKKEEEELEKRPEMEILEKLKSHENEEKKILAESKQILEELKGVRQVQFDKNKRKPYKQFKEVNSSVINKQEDKKTIIISSDEKKNQIEGVVMDKMPIPLVLKEANKSNGSRLEISREKRDLPLTINNVNNDEKEENCEKKDNINEAAKIIKANDENQYNGNVNITH